MKAHPENYAGIASYVGQTGGRKATHSICIYIPWFNPFASPSLPPKRKAIMNNPKAIKKRIKHFLLFVTIGNINYMYDTPLEANISAAGLLHRLLSCVLISFSVKSLHSSPTPTRKMSRASMISTPVSSTSSSPAAFSITWPGIRSHHQTNKFS